MVAQKFKDINITKRFSNKAITTCRQSHGLFFLKSAGCNGYNHRLLALRHRPDTLGRAVTIHHRHTHIHPDKLGLPFHPGLYRLLAGRGFSYFKTQRLQQLHQQLAIFQIIIHHQDPETELARFQSDDLILDFTFGKLFWFFKLEFVYNLHRNRKFEGGTLPKGTLHLEAASHQLHESAANR